jgi:hypothetical protein
VTLSNLRQQLLVSPPLENDPDIRVRGKSIIIDIEEELRPNTTYNLFLGDAVRDITEGNAIPNFQYVFSTGEYVDSLSLGGRVIDAFTLEPAEGISIMLYDSIYDSIPYKERPVYFAKTGKEGDFVISNMKDGTFLIFGLEDNNSNFLFDLPTEKVAFLDSLVAPRYVPPPVAIDTITSDSIAGPDDDLTAPDMPEDAAENLVETPVEAGAESEGTATTPVQADEDTEDAAAGSELTEQIAMPHYSLFLFEEADTVQRITATDILREGLIALSFRIPYDSVCVKDLTGELPENWYIQEFSDMKDSLYIWFADPGRDTLILELFDGIHSLDTIKTAVKPRAASRRSGSEEQEDTPPLTISPGTRTGRSHPYFRPLTVKASAPVDAIEDDKISLLAHDSIPVDVAFSFQDHVRRNLVMDHEFEEGVSYTLDILPGAFTDMFGAVNDTVSIAFTTTSFDDYGVLLMNISFRQDLSEPEDHAGQHSYILHLLDSSGNTMQEMIVQLPGAFTFLNLTPGNYSFRLIEDRNQNGKWDTGNYLKGLQPEKVFLYQEPLQIRQNWEDELSWEIQIKPLTLPRD